MEVKNMEKFSYGVARVTADADSGNEIVYTKDNPVLSYFFHFIFKKKKSFLIT